MTDSTGPNTATLSTGRPRLLYVDALRGLAAVVVLFHHTTTLFPDVYAELERLSVTWHRIAMFVSDRNHDAVMLFFVLSGFSVRLSLGAQGLTSRTDINTYMYRRLKRILPLFCAALALAFCVGALRGRLGEPSFSWSTLAGNLLFLQSSSHARGTWFVPYGDDSPLWSLSYEMFYYLLYPALALGLAMLGRPMRTIAALIAVVLSGLGLALFTVWPAPPFAFLSHFIVWYVGVDLAEQYFSQQRDSARLIALWCGLVVLGIACAIVLPSATLRTWGVALAIYGLWRVYLARTNHAHLAAIANPAHAIAKLGATFGFISYALYLFHYPLLLAAADLFGQSVWVMAATCAAACILAYVAERLAAIPRYGVLQRDYMLAGLSASRVGTPQ
jgi:peptidoglycan/LPS O-acetylase OafA/YrhL